MKNKQFKYTVYGDGNGIFPKLKPLEESGTMSMQIPKDFYLKNGKLNPKYRSTYPPLKNEK